MNLLHVVDTLDLKKGGVSQAVNSMATQITKCGFYNEVITFDSHESCIVSDVFTVHALGPSRGPWSYSNKLIPWLKNNIYRFDAIIVHGLWLYQSYGVTKFLSHHKRQIENLNSNNKVPKLFIMPHGMLDPYFQRSSKRKLKAIRNWLYWKVIERHTIDSADSLLFTCEEEMRLAEEPFKPYTPKKKFVVGLGISEPPKYNSFMREAFYKGRKDLKDKPFLLFLSRIDPKKGLDNLVKAYEIVANDSFVIKGKNLPKLVIAGPGLNTPYGNSIMSIVNSNPILQKSIYFSDMLEGDRKWGAFYSCEAFVLSSHQENFGIAVVEALACAKSVLISNKINISQEIKSYGAGLIEDDTIDGAVKMFKSWIQMSQKEKITMGQRARRCFEHEFAIDGATAGLLRAVKGN